MKEQLGLDVEAPTGFEPAFADLAGKCPREWTNSGLHWWNPNSVRPDADEYFFEKVRPDDRRIMRGPGDPARYRQLLDF
eukprot:7119677-Lingulodinium_polyedra.AAC.1